MLLLGYVLFPGVQLLLFRDLFRRHRQPRNSSKRRTSTPPTAPPTAPPIVAPFEEPLEELWVGVEEDTMVEDVSVDEDVDDVEADSINHSR